MSSPCSSASEEHLQGEQSRAVSPYAQRHDRNHGRVASRGGRAGRGRPGCRAGPGVVAGPGAVAQGERAARSGRDMVDLALSLAVGGDCLADVAVRRDQAERVRGGGLGPDGVTRRRERHACGPLGRRWLRRHGSVGVGTAPSAVDLASPGGSAPAPVASRT